MNQSLHQPPAPTALPAPVPVSFPAADGLSLGGHFWPAAPGAFEGASPAGAADKIVILNPATGVLARYYHRYARFLAGHGFDVLTYDYRGIGASHPLQLRGCGYRWRDWGELDFEAALTFARRQRPQSALLVVGHSIGGFLPGLAPSASHITRMLTVGAQYAWWGDYAPQRRLRLFAKWHLAMPALTALCGYFPGRRLGWLEDLPAGIAYEWSFRRARFERSHPPEERQAALARMAAVTAPVLAVRVTDDELGTGPALRRTLAYYTGAPRTLVRLSPALYGREAIGHFNLFHDSHTAGFWTESLRWLRDGQNPWPAQTTDSLDPQA
ncbi:alpha/beta hydrolase family protein [Radicibacter daui]|uniref:alpha/beta hydrolase family protein n=1 Tax=Radicibacter daui TaxID=3064829 RepID=UPI0040469366